MNYLRFEVYTAVTMKNAVFWDVTPCDSCKNRRFGGAYGLRHQDDKICELGTMLQFADSCHPDDGGDMISETSDFTRATWCHIRENRILRKQII
jgi:hypothetical protein